ncbi:hypothetical protein F2P79_025000 [Pimephales promelas]|nr:hypothetical protein F2P79_025000 [Pimephales promelas]
MSESARETECVRGCERDRVCPRTRERPSVARAPEIMECVRDSLSRSRTHPVPLTAFASLLSSPAPYTSGRPAARRSLAFSDDLQLFADTLRDLKRTFSLSKKPSHPPDKTD